MNTRKKQILSLLIVGALAAIGTGATESYAVVISVDIEARLNHLALSSPIRLVGGGNIDVSGSNIAPGTFVLTDTAGPGWARISWSTGTVSSTGRFRVEGEAVAEWVDPSGTVRYEHFRMVIQGRTDGTSRIRARFRNPFGPTSTSTARLRGRCSG